MARWLLRRFKLAQTCRRGDAKGNPLIHWHNKNSLVVLSQEHGESIEWLLPPMAAGYDGDGFQQDKDVPAAAIVAPRTLSLTFWITCLARRSAS
jgi:hypothetical protein